MLVAGIVNATLSSFLEQNLPKSKSVKKCSFTLGVSAGASLGAPIVMVRKAMWSIDHLVFSNW